VIESHPQRTSLDRDALLHDVLFQGEALIAPALGLQAVDGLPEVAVW
jgi:hypothetical protein